MNRDYVHWHSPTLNREMELLVFGHAGIPVIVFPTTMGRFYQFEDMGMVAAIQEKLTVGQYQLICVDSVDSESWYNKNVPVGQRGERHEQYERYILDEVLPFVRQTNQAPGVWTTGCSFGAYHSANFGFRHPDVVDRIVAMSGKYDLKFLLNPGEYDDHVYFNSPMDYLPNLSDGWYLSRLRARVAINLISGDDPDICYGATLDLSRVLDARGIPHNRDIWHGAWHDWPWWREMLVRHT